MKKINHIFRSILLVLAIIVIGIGMYYFREMHRNSMCKGIKTEVISGDFNTLIDSTNIQNDVLDLIDSIHHTAIKYIPVDKIERKLQSNPYIEYVDVMVTLNGYLKIKAKPRQPFIRIISKNGQSFFIDHKQTLIPTQEGHSAHVIFANGHIPVSLNDSLLRKNYQLNALNNFSVLEEIFILAKHIETSEFLSSQIDQIYRNNKGEYELIPKIGNQVIILGKLDRLDHKLLKLEAFYKQALPYNGWEKYNTINLKYNKQVVCSKI